MVTPAVPLRPPVSRARIAAVLAETETVATAAASAARDAVTDAIADRELIEGRPIVYADDIAFAVRDGQTKRVGWVIVKPDGMPHDYTLSVLGRSFPRLVAMDPAITGYSLAFVDEHNQLSHLTLGPDGKFPQWVIDDIGAALHLSGGGQDEPAIVCYGDSLTLGTSATTSDNAYPAVLSRITRVAVTTAGVGGDGSAGIAARQNGQPYLVTVSGGVIPSSGSVTVTIATATGGGFAFTNGSTVIRGSIAGVPGGIARSGAGPYTYTFTRDASGDAVTLTKPTRWYTELGRAHQQDIHIYWAGNNNPTQTDQIMADIASMVLAQTTNRYLVLGLLNNDSAGPGSTIQNGVIATNTALAARYGNRYVDVRAYLLAYGLIDAALTPTPTDTANIANGIVPASLRVDTIHLNDAGYAVVAQYVADRLIELEWVVWPAE